MIESANARAELVWAHTQGGTATALAISLVYLLHMRGAQTQRSNDYIVAGGLHPVVSWALGRAGGIKAGDVVCAPQPREREKHSTVSLAAKAEAGWLCSPRVWFMAGVRPHVRARHRAGGGGAALARRALRGRGRGRRAGEPNPLVDELMVFHTKPVGKLFVAPAGDLPVPVFRQAKQPLGPTTFFPFIYSGQAVLLPSQAGSTTAYPLRCTTLALELKGKTQTCS
jgi:hypothetical protein